MEKIIINSRDFPSVNNYIFELSKTVEESGIKYWLTLKPVEGKEGFEVKERITLPDEIFIVSTANVLFSKVKRLILETKLDNGPLLVVKSGT